MNRATIERLLEQAKQTQQQVEQALGGSAARSNAQWRTADADRRQLVRRLNAVKAVEQLDTDLKARKSGGDDE